MDAFPIAEKLHRLVKQAIDSGMASSLEEAMTLFHGYRVCLAIGEADASLPAAQTALLTAVALARRVFLGGVTVAGGLDVPLMVPLPLGASLRTAVQALGAQRFEPLDAPRDRPCIFISGPPRPRAFGFQLRAVYSGWSGGVVPAHAEVAGSDQDVVPLAPMLAAALAVSEAFLHVQGRTPVAGRRSIGMSLWQPAAADWLANDVGAPSLCYLPSKLWLIGLGHLGQAYLWALSLLPYAHPKSLSVVLQDTDIITPSSESTCILSNASMAGRKKTRAMAGWAEQRGFDTVIIERQFDSSLARKDDEPAVALCAMDNALGRRALDQVGFPLVVEAGLGRGHRDFCSIRLHTLPAGRPASEIWKNTVEQEGVLDRPAYQTMLRDSRLNRCGITQLAGKAVGAPFVGAVAACLVVGEVLRLLHGASLSQLIDLDLRDMDYRTVVTQARGFDGFNPGYALVHERSVAG